MVEDPRVERYLASCRHVLGAEHRADERCWTPVACVGDHTVDAPLSWRHGWTRALKARPRNGAKLTLKPPWELWTCPRFACDWVLMRPDGKFLRSTSSGLQPTESKTVHLQCSQDALAESVTVKTPTGPGAGITCAISPLRFPGYCVVTYGP